MSSEDKNSTLPAEQSEKELQASGQEDPEEEEFKNMSLREHLFELRSRLFKAAIGAVAGFLACFSVAGKLYEYLALPLERVLPEGSTMIFTGLPEGFLVEVRIAFVAGLFLTSPYLFYQIWSFIAPGLYKEERRYVAPLAFASAFCFIGGAAFCYFVVFPVAFNFFMSFSRGSIQAAPAVGPYLSFALQLLLAFGLVFELPLFSFFLARLGVITARQLRSWRRYAILVAFILAAILTPPDVYSQILMVIPLLGLYEISVLVVQVFSTRKEKITEPQAEEEAEEAGKP